MLGRGPRVVSVPAKPVAKVGSSAPQSKSRGPGGFNAFMRKSLTKSQMKLRKRLCLSPTIYRKLVLSRRYSYQDWF